MRSVVDDFGQPNHECGGAVPLSHARNYRDEWEASGYAELFGDALHQYKRVLAIRSTCDDCRADATEAISELAERFERMAARDTKGEEN